MPSKLSASRLITLTASAIRQQGARLMTDAPWSFGVFVLSLPFVLLVPTLIQLMHPGFVAVLVVVNLLALVRISLAWHRQIALNGSTVGAAGRLRGAGWKYLALIVLFIAVAVALVSANDVMPFLVYAALNNVGGDALFFVCVFVAWAVMWGGLPYLLGIFALSLPSVAVSGKYDFGPMRRALRTSVWPLVGAQVMLIGSAALTRATLSRAVFEKSGGSIAYGALGILFCVASVVVATAMCAVAYRELRPGTGGIAA